MILRWSSIERERERERERARERERERRMIISLDGRAASAVMIIVTDYDGHPAERSDVC